MGEHLPTFSHFSAAIDILLLRSILDPCTSWNIWVSQKRGTPYTFLEKNASCEWEVRDNLRFWQVANFKNPQLWTGNGTMMNSCSTSKIYHHLSIFSRLAIPNARKLSTHASFITKHCNFIQISQLLLISNLYFKNCLQHPLSITIFACQLYLCWNLASWWFQPHLKKKSQIGSFPQVVVRIKTNIWNHHLVSVFGSWYSKVTFNFWFYTPEFF